MWGTHVQREPAQQCQGVPKKSISVEGPLQVYAQGNRLCGSAAGSSIQQPQKPQSVRREETVGRGGQCLLRPFTTVQPLPLENSRNRFDLTRSSQETDSLVPNTHPRLALAPMPTFSFFSPGKPRCCALESLKNGSARRLGKENGEPQADVCASAQHGLAQGLSRHFLTKLCETEVVILEMGKQWLTEQTTSLARGLRASKWQRQHIMNPGLALCYAVLPGGWKGQHIVFSLGHQERREGGGGEDNPMATECLQSQVMALGAPLEGRFFYSLIQLTGAIWEGQPTRKPAFAHHRPGELSRELGGNGVRIANLSPLPPKQNIQGRMGPGLPPGPGHQGKEKER